MRWQDYQRTVPGRCYILLRWVPENVVLKLVLRTQLEIASLFAYWRISSKGTKLWFNMSLKKQGTWFHGSSSELETLRKGSSITRIEKLAQAFSTRPGIVSVSDDGEIKHNGKSKGRVYKVTDRVTTDDIYEHPRSSIKGWEWITKKEFKLEFLYEVSPSPADILTEREIKELKMRQSK